MAVQCSADTFAVNQSLVLRINICDENRHLRQARNRYMQLTIVPIMKEILFSFVLCFLNSEINAQEIGEIREVKLKLIDIPFSGDEIQPNFINDDTREIISFNHMDWLDKHVSLYDFFHRYRDSCSEIDYVFNVTMIFIPKEQFTHVRYEGYIPTGEILNQWVLTSIVRSETEH